MKDPRSWQPLAGLLTFWLMAGCSGGGGGGRAAAAGFDGGGGGTDAAGASGAKDAPIDSTGAAGAAGSAMGGTDGADAAAGGGGSDAAAAGVGGSDAGAGGTGGAAGGGGSDAGASGAGSSDAGGAAGGPMDAGADGAGSGTYRLYAVLDGGSNPSSLEIVDMSTWTLVRNVSIGVRAVSDLEVDPSGAQVFLTDTGKLRSVSTATGADTGGPTLSDFYGALSLSPDKSTLYALGFNGTGTTTLVSAFDRATLTITDSLSMTDGVLVETQFALSPDGSTIALVWFPPAGPAMYQVRIITTTPKLAVTGTYPKTDVAVSDLRTPAFTDDGRVLFYDQNNLYIVPFIAATGVEQPYLNPHPGYNKLATCVYHCLAYDVGAKKGIAHGNNLDLESFDLAAGTAGVGPLQPSGSSARVLIASPGGGLYVDLQHGAGSADTLTDAASNLLYTFSQAKPVAAMRIARTP